MSDGIYSALSGALAQERTLAVVANNLANTSTTGFRGDKVVFGEVVAQQRAQQPAPPASTTLPVTPPVPALPTSPAPSASPQSEVQRFVTIDQIAVDHSAGSLRQTGNPLDVALQGDGYFAVEGAEGVERYTRAGSFVADGEGTLRTQNGLRVLGDSGELQIPQGTKAVTIAADGTISADGQSVGKLKIVRFDRDDAVSHEGLTLFAPNAGAQPLAADTTSVTQGYIETANVNPVAGMQELITVSRSFDAFQKVIEAFRDIDQRTARDVGGK